MVIDTSAVIAILQQDDEAQQFAELIAADRYRLMSAVSHLESAIVIGSRYGDTGKAQLNALLRILRSQLFHSHLLKPKPPKLPISPTAKGIIRPG